MKYVIILSMLFSACTTTKSNNECMTAAKPDCMCTQQYDPVCGCDKKTYGNACTANCAGVKSYTKGECPQ